MSAAGWNWENDGLRVVNPANCKSDMTLIWLTKDEATEFEVGDVAGWYDADSVEYKGDVEFDMGSGFMTSLVSDGVSFQYSGQVYTDSFSISCKDKVYVVIPNALPRTIKMSEVSASGWNWENDGLRILDSATCKSERTLMWLTKEEAVDFEVGDKAGWYDADTVEYAGNIEVAPGDGFMTSLASKSVIINMPSVNVNN